MADGSGSDIPKTNQGFFGKVRSVLPEPAQVARNVGRNVLSRVVSGIGAVEPTGIANLAATNSTGQMEAKLRQIQANAIRRGIQQAKDFLTPSPATDRPSVAVGESPFVGLASPAPLATPEPGGLARPAPLPRGVPGLVRPTPLPFGIVADPGGGAAGAPAKPLEIPLYIPFIAYPDPGIKTQFFMRSIGTPGMYRAFISPIGILHGIPFQTFPDPYPFEETLTVQPHPNGQPGHYIAINPEFTFNNVQVPEKIYKKKKKGFPKLKNLLLRPKSKKPTGLSEENLKALLESKGINTTNMKFTLKKNRRSRKTRKQRR